ncbi:long-chain-acyl-CoA synthetase [Chthonobacter albigriseus]|uniref:long-chain-acyl-CoA synthetase n=1 Tax=Chthonobacter albigriseus TaxID=1683161 RepID=UPI0015EEEDA6|nr:long-chain-acyl-CoA synthetase [Chthonobacter albigriseus]
MSFGERARSEWAYLSGAVRMLKRVTRIARTPDLTWPRVVEDLAARFGERTALMGEGEHLTYAQFHKRGNRYARWAIANGIRKGDVVALMMSNRPEYLAVWLGITRAGGVVALLNTNLAGVSLAHCVGIAKARHVIVSGDLIEAWQSAEGFVPSAPKVWTIGADTVGTPLEPVLDGLSDADLAPGEVPALTSNDRCLFIYTSGTTGLPKAANINHYRVLAIMNGFSAAMKATAEDRMYVCLPLYHTSGGVLAVGTVLTVGGSVMIAKRFSARQFWDDIVDNNCSMAQYIGELCRYLLNSPRHPRERAHRLRIMSGNGLRPDVWLPFKERFAIPQILEWYASTEGNAVLFNLDGKAGSIGRVPKYLERKFLLKVIKYDVTADREVRDMDGRCVECAPDEVGELVSEIVNDPKKPSQRFEGYADQAATEKKILTDVFKTGDRWFRTGDLVRKDSLGYYFFIDRIGDTFRWKGENVATSEVAEALGVFPGVMTPNVYGVQVPGSEGRAGMAAIVAADDIDLKALSRHLDQQLPAYAKPLFLRLKSEIETTGTFKLKKVDLASEGFDPHRIEDPLFFLDPREQCYVRLDAAGYDAIARGDVRL